MENEKTLYSLIEVTSMSKIGYVTLLRMIKSAQLKAVKLGRSWRVPEVELKKLLSGNSS